MVLLGVALLGLRAVPPGLADVYARGIEELSANRPAQAIELFQQVAAHADGKPAAAVGIAQAWLTLAKREESDPVSAFGAARDAWLAAITYEGFSTRVRRGLAEAYLGLENTLAAADQWEVVFASNPTDLSLWRELGRLHLKKGEWDAARRAYDTIAAVEPDNAEAHFWAGVLQMSADAAQSRSHLLRARDDPVYRGRAEKLLLALSDLESVTQASHTGGRLGLAYLAVGEPALAQVQFQAAIDLEPTYADAWAYLGLAKSQRGEDGRRDIARAIELEPDSALAHSLMGHHWLWHNRPRLARPEFILAWKLNPANPAHMADVASTYQREGGFAAAEAWYQAAIRSSPEEPTFWILLARFRLDTLLDVVDGGLLAAQKAVALDPENPAALDALGWAQFLADRIGLAETNLLAARQRDPSSALIRYHLGRLYAHQQEWAKARAAFEEAVVLDGACAGCDPSRRGYHAELAQRALDGLGR